MKQMKNIFSILGFITMIYISIIISKQTTAVVKDIDVLLTELKEKSIKYEQKPIDAEISENTIIPGLNGKKINVEKTYKKLKKIGTINEKYFIYNEVEPARTIKNEYDKYIISGNPEKNMISLIILVQDNDDIKTILEILEDNKEKINFFIEQTWIEKNQKEFKEIIKKGHDIDILNYNNNKQNIWENKTIKQNSKYCYTEEENDEKLDICSKEKKHTIKPDIIATNKPLKEIKKKIKNGSIIAIHPNEQTNKELGLIIKYIKTKGYSIETLAIHLSETIKYEKKD